MDSNLDFDLTTRKPLTARPPSNQPMSDEDKAMRSEVSSQLTRYAMNLRKDIVRRFGNGEISLDDLVTIAQGKAVNRESLYISKLKLLPLLAGVPGWTKQSAEAALYKSGFAANKDTLNTIKSHNQKLETFRSLVDSEFVWATEGNRSMPQERSGWPWKTKIGALADELNVDIGKLLGTAQTPPEAISDAADESRDDDLSSLLADEPESLDDDDIEELLD